jgi:LysM repeat protein
VTYTVVAGDVLSAISVRFDVDLQALIAANQIANPDVLAVGQQLSIPCPGQSPSVTPKATATATPTASR